MQPAPARRSGPRINGDRAACVEDGGPFEAVVFAGGGCRCFWQAGFWEVAALALGLRPRCVDCAPIETIPAPPPPMLVLLTSPYPSAAIPRIDGRVYAQPSEPVPIHKWDYTRPDRVQATFDLGRRDGERFAALVGADGPRAWLESP